MSGKLVIWDFDGVLADTEHLWLETRLDLLNERYNLNWDFDKANFYMGGMSDKTKRESLDSAGIYTDDSFWNEALNRDIKKMRAGIMSVPGVEDILKIDSFDQCVATGGVRDKTLIKLESTGLIKYVPDNHLFTADMVEKGKPEPDLFLLAADKMGYLPKDCLVIEDSLAGMTAGIKAGMTVIAFLGCEMNKNAQYAEKVNNLGIKNIFYDMKSVKDFIIDFTKD